MGNSRASTRVTGPRNPIHGFWQLAEKDGVSAYKALFSNPAIAPPFHACAKQALAAKRAHLGTPLLGEVYPFMLEGSCQLPDGAKRDLFAAWLAFYIYTVIVDSALDQKGNLSATEALSASAYLALGTTLFGKHVLASPYENIYTQNVGRAFLGQCDDLRKRRSTRTNRTRSDIDKNRAIVACAAAFVAASTREPVRLITFTEKMLQPFQALDDLQDVKTDLDERNLTNLVRAITKHEIGLAPLSQEQCYAILHSDGILTTHLETVRSEISQALRLLDPKYDTRLLSYFSCLLSNLEYLLRDLKELPTSNFDAPRDFWTSRIRPVAQSS